MIVLWLHTLILGKLSEVYVGTVLFLYLFYKSKIISK